METLDFKKKKLGGSGGARGCAGLFIPQSAVSYVAGIGKGLREPGPPYRPANVFGADLNTPNAESWNYAAEVVDPSHDFDLSSITPDHEVVVALLVAYNLLASASYQVEHKWYRDRDGRLLFTLPHTIPDPASQGYGFWYWYYVYSYIGYVPWEIYENGSYHVDILFDGSLLQRMAFTVSGIGSTPQVSDFKIADFSRV